MRIESQIFYSTIRDSINWNLTKKKGGNNLLDYIYDSFEGVKNLVLVVFIITSHPKKREYKKEWKKENLWSFKRTIMDKLTLTLWVWSWWHQIPVIFFQNSLKPTFSSFSLYEKFGSASTLNALPLLAYMIMNETREETKNHWRGISETVAPHIPRVPSFIHSQSHPTTPTLHPLKLPFP